MKKWSELMEENREVIIEKMVAAFEEAEGGMPSSSIGVEIDQDGDVWTTGMMSRGNQSESSWEGKTTIVDNINAWTFDYNELDELNSNLPELNYIKEAFEKYKIEEDDEYASFRMFMINNHIGKLDEWDREAFQLELDSFRDNANDRLNTIIENQKQNESDEAAEQN